MSKQLSSIFALVGILFLAVELRAQGGPTLLQFSFSNPGARSLGLGGAFAALADDATAAFANPAGLIQLTRPEASIEGRYWSYSTPYTVGGRVSGEATGIGLDGPIRVEDSEFDTSEISFLSFVYPGHDWTLALSRHQSARFETFSRTQGLFTDDRIDDPQPRCLLGSDVCRYPDFTNEATISIVSTTASVAFRLTDAFSLGVGLSYLEGDLQLTRSQYEPIPETLPLGFFGPNAYLDEARLGTGEFEFDNTDWGVNLGFLWFPTRQLSLGGFFRQGGSFPGIGAEISGPLLDPPVPVGSIGRSDSSIPLKVPNVYGLGLAYRSKGGSWTTSFEWDRVLYSSIVRSIGGSPLVDTDEITLDDADEFRFGFEYAVLGWKPLVAFRGGIWHDPDHTIQTFENDPLEQALLPGGQDDTHLSLGCGIAFKNLQIDVGVDLSDLVDTGALSLIYRF